MMNLFTLEHDPWLVLFMWAIIIFIIYGGICTARLTNTFYRDFWGEHHRQQEELKERMKTGGFHLITHHSTGVNVQYIPKFREINNDHSV